MTRTTTETRCLHHGDTMTPATVETGGNAGPIGECTVEGCLYWCPEPPADAPEFLGGAALSVEDFSSGLDRVCPKCDGSGELDAIPGTAPALAGPMGISASVPCYGCDGSGVSQ